MSKKILNEFISKNGNVYQLVSSPGGNYRILKVFKSGNSSVYAVHALKHLAVQKFVELKEKYT